MSFQDATPEMIDKAMSEAAAAFSKYKLVTGSEKARFLRAIAEEIDALGDSLVKCASRETNLPEARIIGERARTTGHCRMFADLVEEGSWVEARIDTAIPDRSPAPKPDLRKMLVALGPVVVFGASNFPLAYSTAGGDTASALAAGCPVIVKAHPAHAETSVMVAGAIEKAAKRTHMPEGVFHHVMGSGFEVGKALVMHPLTKAVGFTGSYLGGKALFDLANSRPEPIPVFAEMGSINPVFILPGAMKSRAAEVAAQCAASITLGVGQFCTNPGLLLTPKNAELSKFTTTLADKISEVAPSTMLHPGIASAYWKKRAAALQQKGVTLLTESRSEGGKEQGRPTVATVNLKDFKSNHLLVEEVFGPYSLLVQGDSLDELEGALDIIPGQLTCTIIGDEEELVAHRSFIERLREKAGRLIINGVPTGVEVCPSMQHGGPFPATTDSRFTSVGTDAIKRFARPVCFQNFPPALLPPEVQDGNPLGIWRIVDSKFEK